MQHRNIKDLPNQKRLHELFIYNFETGELINRINNKHRLAGERAGSIDRHGYRRIYIDRKIYAEHRIIWSWVHGYLSPSHLIDHINLNKQDNRLANLRIVSASENNRNTILSRVNKTGYRGVTQIRSANKYQARIRSNGKNKHLGIYETALEAFRAYSLARATTYNTNNNNISEAN